MKKTNLFLVILLCLIAFSSCSKNDPINDGVDATATAVVQNGKVTSITVTNPGSGYTSVPNVIIDGGGGSGATAKATVSNGSVSKIDVTNSGAGYSSVPNVIISQSDNNKPNSNPKDIQGTWLLIGGTDIIDFSANRVVSYLTLDTLTNKITPKPTPGTVNYTIKDNIVLCYSNYGFSDEFNWSVKNGILNLKWTADGGVTYYRNELYKKWVK